MSPANPPSVQRQQNTAAMSARLPLQLGRGSVTVSRSVHGSRTHARVEGWPLSGYSLVRMLRMQPHDASMAGNDETKARVFPKHTHPPCGFCCCFTWSTHSRCSVNGVEGSVERQARSVRGHRYTGWGAHLERLLSGSRWGRDGVCWHPSSAPGLMVLKLRVVGSCRKVAGGLWGSRGISL